MDQVRPAKTAPDWDAVRRLFQAYASSLSIDLEFQGFRQELTSLPGSYARPKGAVYLAESTGEAVGCIGLRPFAGAVGELKRLYVVPAFRNRGFGQKLVAAAVAEARSAGYQALVLDTLASMSSAIALYESFGFKRTAAYYPNPLPEVVYFRAEL